MSKIKTLRLQNFKAIADIQADFNGCTAIVTGGNNKGKTSFLQGLVNRIRFVRPDVMVKEGATDGKGEMTLDTGERFIWEFDVKGKDKLTLITKEGEKRNVTVELGAKYFPKTFDIDKFLNSTPKQQSKQLQDALGINTTEIDSRYLDAYNKRKDKNALAEKYQVKLTQMMEVPPCEFVDVEKLKANVEQVRTKLNNEYLANKKTNDELRAKWNADCDAVRKSVNDHNTKQAEYDTKITTATQALNTLQSVGYDGQDVQKFITTLSTFKQPTQVFEQHQPKEPAYIQEMPNDAELQEANNAVYGAVETNVKAQAYKDYIDYKATVKQAKIEAEEAEAAVKAIEAERNEMIAAAKMPDGVEFGIDGLTYNKLPIDRNQLSSSRITILALQIATFALGDVKTLFFDASYLDKNSLSDVNEYAKSQGLQLLIERPDFEGGEIEYRLICDNSDSEPQTTLFN
jgi:predicted ATP-dependent endonuclease of OLD family